MRPKPGDIVIVSESFMIRVGIPQIIFGRMEGKVIKPYYPNEPYITIELPTPDPKWTFELNDFKLDKTYNANNCSNT